MPRKITLSSGSGSITGNQHPHQVRHRHPDDQRDQHQSGGTILSTASIALSGPGAAGSRPNDYTLGSGPVYFRGGTLQTCGYGQADNTSSYGFVHE